MATAPGAEALAEQRRLERRWWRALLAVLYDPVAVFSDLRDDNSEEAADARQEPLLAVIWLAGIALVLGTGAAAHLFDDFEISGLVVPVWAFIAGGIYGGIAYFVVAAFVLTGADLAGARETYARSRHLVGLAAVPVALSLLAWPFRLGLYGSDVFRSGGADSGAGGAVFEGIEVACIAWWLALVVVGLRTLHRWTWARALAAASIPALVPAVVLLRAYGAI